jgi:hypothetical protein
MSKSASTSHSAWIALWRAGSAVELCGELVSWWEGEYEGECVLPRSHRPHGVHFDGLSWFDELREEVALAGAPLAELGEQAQSVIDGWGRYAAWLADLKSERAFADAESADLDMPTTDRGGH